MTSPEQKQWQAALDPANEGWWLVFNRSQLDLKFNVKFHYQADDLAALLNRYEELEALVEELRSPLATIVGGIRAGWWGEGSGELELGEMMLAENAIAKAAAWQQGEGGT